MRLLLSALLLLTGPMLAMAKSHDDDAAHESSEGRPIHLLVELTPGIVLYSDTSVKVQPTIGLEGGLRLPLWTIFSVEALIGYQISTTTAFDTFYHGPIASTFLMAQVGPFQVGLGPKGGLDFRSTTFQGGWVGFDAKAMIGLGGGIELGLQAGPRLQFLSGTNRWGADAMAVLAWVM